MGYAWNQQKRQTQMALQNIRVVLEMRSPRLSEAFPAKRIPSTVAPPGLLPHSARACGRLPEGRYPVEPYPEIRHVAGVDEKPDW